MGLRDTFLYHNFSWRGDPRWADASAVTRCAPLVVLSIFGTSVVQIALGAVWIVDEGKNMTVPKIIQTLLIPGLSFFNAVPSLHLHLLLRSNPPLLALCFSTAFACIYLLSTILMLASCLPPLPTSTNSTSPAPGAASSSDLRRTECPLGKGGEVRAGLWDAVVVTGWVSVALYGCHAGMAAWVSRVRTREREREKGLPVDEGAEEERRARARELWVKMVDRQQGF